MADNSARTSHSDRRIEQAIVVLKKGAHLLKCGRRGKPKFCPFRLSMDEKVLVWYSGEKEKHLKLNSVSKIVPGQKTINFLRQLQPEMESRSFSLIYQNGERSLDLICKDKEQAESWLLGLTAMVSVSHHPRPLAILKNSRGAHSCVNSPIGHTLRKHKLGLVQDSVKISQVRSLYGSPPSSVVERYFYNSLSDSCDVFYSSRKQSLSDMKPLLDKMLPRLRHVVSKNSNDTSDSDTIKERIMISKISLSDYGTSATDDKTDALKDLFMWGEGIGGILGGVSNRCEPDGSKIDALLPKLLESTRMLDVQHLSCGEKHAALVTKHGEIFCWGKEKGGRLGHRINIDVPCPKVVESLSRDCVQTIACGVHHTCAVTTSGELYSWGDSSHGVSLSVGGYNRSQWFPSKISGPLDGITISSVACGEWHTAVVSSSGQLFTYGDGTFGVLGHGNVHSFSQPKEVESLAGLRVKSVACGPWHTAAIVDIMLGRYKGNAPCGKLFTWGDSDSGRLGHADKERKLLPTCVVSLVDSDFVQVSCGTTLTVALTVNGIVFTIGSSANGQLGNPRAENTSITNVGGSLVDEFVKVISSGSFHVAALTSKGRVYTWGKGANGRLGLGDTNDRDSPTLVDALEDRLVKSISCGSGFTAAICLHKSISGKDQAVCSGCGMVFGFTRKKHNCYNCGSSFCHSCSSMKATDASLAPNKSKKSRVCDPCFTQLREYVDPVGNKVAASPRQPPVTRKGLADLKVNMEEMHTRAKNIPSILSTQEDMELFEGSSVTTQGSHRYHHDLYSTFLATTQQWGQVPCPLQFNNASFMTKLTLSRSTSCTRDIAKIDKVLTEELQNLHAQAMILTRQCQSNNQKLQQNKIRIEETWSLARDEAAERKAAEDVIKVLTSQLNAISEKISSGRDTNNARSKVNVCTPRPVRRELSEPEDVKMVCKSSHLPSDLQILEKQQRSGLHGQTTLSSDALPDANRTIKEPKFFNGTIETGTSLGESSPKALKDEWVEQDERGVYITFIKLPNGRKGLKRVRFSRKHFGAKEATQWWDENQSKIYLKYDVERVVTSAKDKREK